MLSPLTAEKSQMYNFRDALATAVAVQRHNGCYLKPYDIGVGVDFSKQANGPLVRCIMDTACDQSHAFSQAVRQEAEKISVTPQDRNQANHILEYFHMYAMEMVVSENVSDFDRKLVELSHKSQIRFRDLGQIAVMPHIYSLKLSRDEREDLDLKFLRTSDYVGVLHKRNQFQVRLEYTQFIRKIDAHLYVCSVDNRHVLKFFHRDGDFLEVGMPCTITAYVKSHEVGRDRHTRETMVNRVKRIQ
jgi:hypothetical protein